MRIARPSALALLALLCVPWPVAATTLAEALAAALAAQPELAAGRARLEAARARAQQADALSRPRLQARTTATAALTAADGATPGVGQALELAYPLWDGGRAGAEQRRAAAGSALAVAELAVAEQRLMLAVVEVYSAVVRDIELLRLTAESQHRLHRQLQAARERYRLGELTTTDILLAESRLEGVNAERARLEGALAQAAAEYRRLVGTLPEDLEPPTGPPGDAAADGGAAIEAHPLLMAARHELERAEGGADVARAGRRPRLALSARASYGDRSEASFEERSELGVGAALVVPLYEGGGDKARLREQLQLVAERRALLDETRARLRRDLDRAEAETRALRQRIAALEGQRLAAARALAGVVDEARLGQRTVLDVLDAEAELARAEGALVTARREALIADWQLAAALGVLRP